MRHHCPSVTRTPRHSQRSMQLWCSFKAVHAPLENTWEKLMLLQHGGDAKSVQQTASTLHYLQRWLAVKTYHETLAPRHTIWVHDRYVTSKHVDFLLWPSKYQGAEAKDLFEPQRTLDFWSLLVIKVRLVWGLCVKSRPSCLHHAGLPTGVRHGV